MVLTMKKSSKTKSSLIKPDVEVVESVEAELYKRVRSYIAKARTKVYAVANKEMVSAYWNVGREIVEKQGGAERAKYGDGLIKGLSLKLTAEFGAGYTSTNLKYMRLVFLAFPNRHTLCDQLNWSHYYERERMNPGDNPPVGIVLGSDRDEAVIRYTLNEHERNLFAVKYHLNLPTEEELQRELQRERAAFEEAHLLAAPQKAGRARIRGGAK